MFQINYLGANMENNDSQQNPHGSILDSDDYQELTKLIQEAAVLDLNDQQRLNEISKLSVGDGERLDWYSFSIMAIRGLFVGYKNGELSFEKMMKIAWNCTLPLRDADLGFHAMGALAAIAIKTTPTRINAKKPPFPTWVKHAAVEYALLLSNTNPNLKLSPNKEGETAETVPSLTLKQLALFEIDIGEKGNRLSEKTIYEWLRSHKHDNNIPLKNTGRKNTHG